MQCRILPVTAAAMLLSGCGWVGPKLYKGDPADAGPIGPGLYKVDVLGDGKPAHKYRIAWLPDGSTSMTPLDARKNDTPWHSIATRFDVPGRQLWIVQDASDDDQTEVSYGLEEMHSDILWLMPFLDCEATADIVRAAGGEVEYRETAVGNVMETGDMPMPDMPMPPTAPNGESAYKCRFKDRDSLDRGLRAYVATNPSQWVRVRFTRIGD